jgi:hypothetical protein
MLIAAAVLAAGCQDFDSPTGPNPRVVGPTATGPAGARTAVAPKTGTFIPTREVSGRTRIWTGTALPAGTRTRDLTGGSYLGTILVPAGTIDAKNGVPILEAILNNPIKAENEYRNRMVHLQGLGTVGKDRTGYIITFPTTAVAPGKVKPKPGIVARISLGDEGPFAELKRDATVTIQAVVRSWKLEQPDTYRGVVIELDHARLIAVAHPGY